MPIPEVSSTRAPKNNNGCAAVLVVFFVVLPISSAVVSGSVWLTVAAWQSIFGMLG